MIKIQINNCFMLADLCVALARKNGIKLNRNAPLGSIGKRLAKNVRIDKPPKRFTQPWYQGLMLNYVQNNGRIVTPLKKFYSPTGTGLPAPVIEIPEWLWDSARGAQKPYVISNKNKNKNKNSRYSNEAANELYKSDEWRRLRYRVLREQNGRCQLCGKSQKDGVILHVDHIVPLSIDWSKRLDINNLQVLCSDCNLGKSNTDTIDWRK